jgi:hypothetical protein
MAASRPDFATWRNANPNARAALEQLLERVSAPGRFATGGNLPVCAAFPSPVIEMPAPAPAPAASAAVPFSFEGGGGAAGADAAPFAFGGAGEALPDRRRPSRAGAPPFAFGAATPPVAPEAGGVPALRRALGEVRRKAAKPLAARAPAQSAPGVEIALPMSADGLEAVKQQATRSGVGVGEDTIVNLDVRTTWQLLPHQFDIANRTAYDSKTLATIMHQVAKDLGTSTDYEIGAVPYKLLIYEPGCFFKRHRDNERIDGMFGTLVVELPSVYEGAELRVWQPSMPEDVPPMLFGGSGGNEGAPPSLKYFAFYADCHHEVSELMSGVRTALVYSLVAKPSAKRHLPRALPLPDVPPQPADGVAALICDAIREFSTEDASKYAPPPEYFPTAAWHGAKAGTLKPSPMPAKPAKFVIVLLHHYTPDGLTGLAALKGRDRAIGEMLAAACQLDEGIEAYLSLAILHDHGENTPQVPYNTTGPLIPLQHSAARPFDLGPPNTKFDTVAAHMPEWYNCGSFIGPDEDQFTEMVAESCTTGTKEEFMERYEEMGLEMQKSHEQIGYSPASPWSKASQAAHSMQINTAEILLTSDEKRKERDTLDEYNSSELDALHDDPSEVEFLGNGGCYEGRWYSRAVLMFWPRSHRARVQRQTKGGEAAWVRRTHMAAFRIHR